MPPWNTPVTPQVRTHAEQKAVAVDTIRTALAAWDAVHDRVEQPEHRHLLVELAEQDPAPISQADEFLRRARIAQTRIPRTRTRQHLLGI